MARRGRAEEALATLQVQRLLTDCELTPRRSNRPQFPLQVTDIGLTTEKSPQCPKLNFPQLAASTFPSLPNAWKPVSFPLSSRVLCDPHQQLSPPAFTPPFRSVEEWHRDSGPQRRREAVKTLKRAIWCKIVERLGDLLLKNAFVVTPHDVISLRSRQYGVKRQITAHRHSEMHRAPISIANSRGMVSKPSPIPAISTPLNTLCTEIAVDSRSVSPVLVLGGSFCLGTSTKVNRTGSATRRRYERQPNNPYLELSRTKFPALSGLLEGNTRLGGGRAVPGQFRASVCGHIKRILQPTSVPLASRTPQRRSKPAFPLL